MNGTGNVMKPSRMTLGRLAMGRRAMISASATTAIVPLRSGWAKSDADATVRVGMLTDMSGPYTDVTGPVGVACARQALAEFNNTNPGIAMEMLVTDHQNKPDIAVSRVREWFDRGGVDMILGVDSSAVALACTAVVADLDKVHLNTGAGTSALTGKACNANTIHWTQDTWNIPHSTATAVVKSGGDTWFFITVTSGLAPRA